MMARSDCCWPAVVPPPSFGVVAGALRVVAGAAWILATDAGPLTVLNQSPFPRTTDIALGMACLALLMVLSRVNALSVQVETMTAGGMLEMFMGVFKGLVQPFHW